LFSGRTIIGKGGENTRVFQQKNQEVVSVLQKKDWTIYHENSKWSSHFEALNQFIQSIRKKGVKLILFINPYHAQYLESIWLTGNWELLENWKRTLVRLLSPYDDIPLWDFNDYNSYTSEEEPVVGNTKDMMKWFWEPAHYRKEFGDVMLAQMLKLKDTDSEVVEQVGVKLDSDNVESVLKKLRSKRNEYASHSQHVVKRIKSIVEENRTQ